jgi:energy-coupling factor transporter ATP-binding protein EcfA2
MLEVLDLTCERGERSLFSGLNFAAPRGTLLRIAGPNGTGKTSLLRILCGLLEPVAGEVRWHGKNIRRLREEYWKDLVYVGHLNGVKDDLTVRENLRVNSEVAGRPASATRFRRRWMRSVSPVSRTRWPASCRRGSVAASRWRGCTSAKRRRCGSSTSRSPRSTCAVWQPVDAGRRPREEGQHGRAGDAPGSAHRRSAPPARRVRGRRQWGGQFDRGVGVLRILLQVIRRDLLLAVRQKADVLNTLFFFVVVVTMVPLGIGPEPNLLRAIGPGVVWVAALLAAILSLARLFANDYADGTLEQMLLSSEPLLLIVLGKAAAHWLVTGLPLTVMSVLFGVVFDLGRRRPGTGGGTAARHAGAVADRCGRSGADPRIERGRGANIAAGPAALHPGADLRLRRGRCGGHRRELRRVPPTAGRLPAVRNGPDAVGGRHGTADLRRIGRADEPVDPGDTMNTVSAAPRVGLFWFASPQTFYPLAGR